MKREDFPLKYKIIGNLGDTNVKHRELRGINSSLNAFMFGGYRIDDLQMEIHISTREDVEQLMTFLEVTKHSFKQ